MKFELHDLSDQQARIIVNALDFYIRILCGQLSELNFVIKFNRSEPMSNDCLNKAEALIAELKSIYFPELDKHSSYSIGGNKTPEEAKVAFDLIQVIRHCVAWAKHPEGGITVDFDKPFIKYGLENFIKANKQEKEE